MQAKNVSEGNEANGEPCGTRVRVKAGSPAPEMAGFSRQDDYEKLTGMGGYP